jgi:hypothetical protein
MEFKFYIVLVGLLAVFAWFGFGSRGAFRRFTRNGDEFHDSKLVSVLVGLDQAALSDLLSLYRKEFGPGPARYARKTLQAWRSGKVRPARRTYERFLLHLPKVMSYDLKCEVLRHFMEEYAAKEAYELDVSTDDWELKLAPLVRAIIDKAFTTQLPIEVERKLAWLGEGDMRAAQEILRSSQAEEGRIMVSQLSEEFANIDRLLSESSRKPKISHMLEFPYGTIRLNIKKRNG